MYLISDTIGPASGVLKGKAGEKVIVISNQYAMWLVVGVETGEKFHVWPEQLSNDPLIIKPTTNDKDNPRKRRNSVK